MSADDHLKLPEVMYNDVRIRLEPAEQKRYDQFERDYIMSFDGADVTAANALALSGKLQQLANGAVYDEDGKVQVFHNQKLDATEEIIEESAGKPVMVVYWFKHDLERIRERFPKVRTLDDRKSMDDWNAGRIPLLALHPASAGHGLNLQFGGSTMVWFSHTWSREKYEQTIGRLRRPGQKDDRITLHRLVVRGTVDEDMLAALSSRGAEQSAFMRAIRARVRKVRGATALPDRG
jgi:SNF2 family DNA or RNA helicase